MTLSDFSHNALWLADRDSSPQGLVPFLPLCRSPVGLEWADNPPERWHSITRGHSARGRSRGTGLQAADNWPLRDTTNTHQRSGFTVAFCKAEIGHLQLPGVLLKFWPSRHALRKQFFHWCHICIYCLNRAVLISLLHHRSFLSKHNCDKAISTLAAMQNRREKGDTGREPEVKYGGLFSLQSCYKHWS